MEEYLKGLDEDLWIPIKEGDYDENWINFVGGAPNTEPIAATKRRKEENDWKCMWGLRGALPPVVYGYVRG